MPPDHCAFYRESEGCTARPRIIDLYEIRTLPCEFSPTYRCPITDAVLRGEQPAAARLPLATLLRTADRASGVFVV